MKRLLKLMAQLRDPESGCPWDRAQTFSTIAPYTIEEAYEVADAITRNDMGELCDELGDLLFQVAFHAQLAKEAGHFDFDAVETAIVEKMTRRHPHVFAPPVHEPLSANMGPSTAAVIASWEEIKAAERAAKRAPGGALDDVPLGLAALKRAEKLQRRAAKVGFDWPDLPPVLEKVEEELGELTEEINKPSTESTRLSDELGDLLFSCVNLARHLDLDPDRALREANNRFETRFRCMEVEAEGEGGDLKADDLDTLEARWQRAKRAADR